MHRSILSWKRVIGTRTLGNSLGSFEILVFHQKKWAQSA
jgi:hypothetical protein